MSHLHPMNDIDPALTNLQQAHYLVLRMFALFPLYKDELFSGKWDAWVDDLFEDGYLYQPPIFGKDIEYPMPSDTGDKALSDYYKRVGHDAVSTLLDDLVNDKERTQ